jgi:hypothetical protein
MPGLEQLRRRSREDTDADFDWQGIFHQHQRRMQGGEQGWRGKREMILLGLVLRLFNGATAAVVASAFGVLTVGDTVEKFKAGNRLKLAMRGGGQPKERCQCKKNVSEMPHASHRCLKSQIRSIIF